MTESSLAASEAARLSRLQELSLVDDGADEVLDGFTRLAASVTGMPAASLALMHADTLLIKSAVGLPTGLRIARELTFCNHAIHLDGVFEVENAPLDPRFAHLPMVAPSEGPRLVHYAAAALVLPTGERIGSLCVGSTEPGRLSDAQRQLLQDLAAQVVRVLLLRGREQKLHREKLVAEAVQLAELAPVGMFSADVAGDVVHGNTQWARMMGAPSYGDMLGDAWLDFVDARDRAEVAAQWRVARCGRSPLRALFRTCGPEESKLRWIRLHLAPVESGVNTMGFVGACTDATETIRLGEQLSRALDASGLGLWELDLRTRQVYLSRSWAQLLGYPAQEMVLGEEAALKLLPAEELPRLWAEWRKMFKGASGHMSLEHRHAKANGERIWVLTEAQVAERGPDGRVVKVVGTCKNITARKQRDADLRAAMDAAAQASRAKSDFLATMSHEIRTPLNGVIGLAQVLSTSRLPASEAEAVRMIDSCAKSLLSLVDNILDFSKIEAGKLTLEEVPTDINALVRELGDLFRVRATDKGIRFRAGLAPGVPQWVLADPGRLRQILLNLLGNALKFTSEGSFSLHVSKVRRGEVEHLAFAVADTGIGIPKADQARLFTRFTQVDASASRRFQGTGLGLAISRQLGQLMGGEVELDSAPGEGSVFTLRIPLRPAAAPAAKPVDSNRACRVDARILLAEDNEVNQLVAQRMLASLGYQSVTTVDDGLQALAAWDRQAFDLVLMDCQMPGMDGLQATRELRARGIQVPVIAFTASATSGDRDACLEAGMNDYLTKPVERAVLADKLLRWLEDVPEAVAAPAPAGVPVFDARVLDDIFFGEREMYEQARGLFVRQARPMLEQLAPAIAAADWDAVRHLAHKIRGGAGTLGACLLAQLCGKIEEAVGDTNAPHGAWAQEAASAFEAYLSESQSVAA